MSDYDDDDFELSNSNDNDSTPTDTERHNSDYTGLFVPQIIPISSNSEKSNKQNSHKSSKSKLSKHAFREVINSNIRLEKSQLQHNEDNNNVGDIINIDNDLSSMAIHNHNDFATQDIKEITKSRAKKVIDDYAALKTVTSSKSLASSECDEEGNNSLDSASQYPSSGMKKSIRKSKSFGSKVSSKIDNNIDENDNDIEVDAFFSPTGSFAGLRFTLFYFITFVIVTVMVLL